MEDYLAVLRRRNVTVRFISEDSRPETTDEARSSNGNPSQNISEKYLCVSIPQFLTRLFPGFLKTSFYRASSALRLKRYFDRDRLDLLHVNLGTFPQNEPASLAAILSRARLKVLTVHNADLTRKKKTLWSFIFGRCFKHTIAVNEFVQKELVEYYGFPFTRVHLIYNGAAQTIRDGPVSGERKLKYDVGEKERLILFPARLDPDKGHDVLIEALSIMPRDASPFKVFLAGEGKIEEALKLHAKERGLDNQIIFGGYQEDMDELYALCDFVILPSLTEGFPYALLEAMAARKPVLATDVGGVKMLVGVDGAGIVVPPNSPTALAEALRELLAESPERLRAMGEKGHQRVCEHFSSERMLEKTFACYEKFSPTAA